MDSSPDIEVIYQDSTLLAVNKPAGLLTIRDGYNPDLSYASRLLEPGFGRLWVVHRLDKDTSGVLLFARTAEAHRELNLQFENRTTHKEYRAIILGIPPWKEIILDFPLQVNGDRRHRTIVDPEHGKKAQTYAEVLESFGTASFVSALPKTGYTHQIRAHLTAAGYPILFDPLYGVKIERLPENLKSIQSQRLALHAFSLSFLHPLTHHNLTVTAPLPTDFQSMLSQLSPRE